PLSVSAPAPGPAMVMSLSTVRHVLVRLMVPDSPGARSTLPPAGVAAMAARSDPGPSSRLVTVAGTHRASSGSRDSARAKRWAVDMVTSGKHGGRMDARGADRGGSPGGNRRRGGRCDGESAGRRGRRQPRTIALCPDAPGPGADGRGGHAERVS